MPWALCGYSSPNRGTLQWDSTAPVGLSSLCCTLSATRQLSLLCLPQCLHLPFLTFGMFVLIGQEENLLAWKWSIFWAYHPCSQLGGGRRNAGLDQWPRAGRDQGTMSLKHTHTPSEQNQLGSGTRFLRVLPSCYQHALKDGESPKKKKNLFVFPFNTSLLTLWKKPSSYIYLKFPMVHLLFLICTLLYILSFTCTLKSLPYKSSPILLNEVGWQWHHFL